MVFRRKIPPEVSAYARLLRQHLHLSYREIAKECKISSSSAKRHGDWNLRSKKRHNLPTRRGRGRPRKISAPQERYLLRELKKLRQAEGSFSMPRLLTVTGMSRLNMTTRTALNVIHRHGYRFRQARKKGLLKPRDLTDRMKFANQFVTRPKEFWCNDVAFFLDAVAFVYKTNPLDQARAPKSRIFRKASEGLSVDCTSKGKKEGSGGKMARFMVAITHGKGVLICEPYEKLDGQYFAKFIDENFERLFELADKDTNLFLQDGDPSQNSAVAKEALKRVKAQLLTIPSRSPDVNPIENVFHLAGNRLRADALHQNITKETFEQFQNRIVETMYSLPTHILDKTIESTRKRLKCIISQRGKRTKY